MSWLSEFRVDAKAPRRRREGSQGAVPPSKKEAASAADAPGTGIEKGCKNAAFFPVPNTVLFSNQLLEDLDKIWELRHIIPNPNVVEVAASV